MKKIIRVQQRDDSLMHLTWVINNICTNACSYCPSELHNGTNHNYDWNNARKFFEVLFQRYPKIHCSVSGGEPSVSPFFQEIVKIFYEAGHTIGATSNAAKPVAYWEDISKYLSYICFSYHPEFADKDFIKKVTAASKNTLVTARVMMYPKMWDHCLDIYNQLIEVPHIFVEPVRVLDWNGAADTTASNYTEDQLKFFAENTRGDTILRHLPDHRIANINATFYFNDNTVDEQPNTVDYTNMGMTNFNGYTCEVGLKSLFVSYLGDVQLANCGIYGSIGNIDNPDNVKWPTAPIVCNKSLCHCSSDININKWETV